MYAQSAGIMLLSAEEATNVDSYDGGLTFVGQPIQFLLGLESGATAGGSLLVRDAADFGGLFPTLFEIDADSYTASFSGLAVNVANGSLAVGGSPVLTQAGAPAYLANQGFVSNTNLGTSIKSMPNFLFGSNNSAIGTESVVFSRGSAATGNHSFAAGYYATASGHHSVAFGYLSEASNTYAFAGSRGTATGVGATAFAYGTATGQYSLATGRYSTAGGQYSVALSRATATGNFSAAIGLYSNAQSYASVVLGPYNTIDQGSSTQWNNVDPVFVIGNGPGSSQRSNAITTLKSGQTILTNRAWKHNNSVSPSAGNSHANALIVEGHAVFEGNTTLKGNVVLETPQGDISMGIFGN